MRERVRYLHAVSLNMRERERAFITALVTLKISRRSYA
jgi:hypothetical protein